MNRKLVYIEWLDHIAFTEAQWRTPEEYDNLEPAKCVTVGYVVKETDDFITVVQTIHEIPEDEEFEQTEKFNGDMCIIKGCIKKMVELKIGKT